MTLAYDAARFPPAFTAPDSTPDSTPVGQRLPDEATIS